MNRLPLIVGNWKMNLTPSEAAEFASKLRIALEPEREAIGSRLEIALAPAYPALERLGRALEESAIGLAAQNVHAEASGAFTGEVSVSMLEDLGCRYALIGHSERRHIMGERDADVAAKAVRLLASRVDPILCVGETLEEREREATTEIVHAQLEAVLDAGGEGLVDRLVVAYEPVWAIGTGLTATPEIAQEVHASIREVLRSRWGDASEAVRILYGGSVKPDNVAALRAKPDVDGALIGGASLDPDSLAAIALAGLE